MLAPIDTKTSSSVERVGLRPTPRSTRLESGTSSAATMKNAAEEDRKSTRLNSSHLVISYAVFCLKKKKNHSLVVNIFPAVLVADHAETCQHVGCLFVVGDHIPLTAAEPSLQFRHNSNAVLTASM